MCLSSHRDTWDFALKHRLRDRSYALGVATVNDTYLPLRRSFRLALWELSTWSGPTLGPLGGECAVQATGWGWTIWELVWVNWATLLFAFSVLLEKMPQISSIEELNVRQRTGNNSLRAED